MPPRVNRRLARWPWTLANAARWLAITGEIPPQKAPSAKDYSRAGLHWFDYYGGDAMSW